MRYARLFWLTFSMSTRAAVAFRTNLLFDLLVSLVTLGGAVAAIELVFVRTDALAGWTKAEALVLVGTFQLMGGLRATFIDPGLSWFPGRVREGRLDLYLLQPAPGLFLASLGSHAPLALIQVALGAGVIGLGLAPIGVPGASAVLAWLLLIAVGAAITWALGVLLACLAFWAPRLELDVLYGAAWEFARYPVDIYRRPLRLFLTYAFPMAVITTLPTRALVRGADPALLAGGLAAGAVAVGLAIAAWRLGLRRYTGATS